ncbi:MAG: FAD-binding domain-containing protein, partial [Pseudomonadota bacterium]
RNHDFGPEDRRNVSCLSGHVRHRLVLERELAEAALEHHGLRTAEKFIQEVFWRTYWKGWLEMRPRVWRDYLSAVDNAQHQVSRDKALSAAYQHAVDGETGIECFDAWARELIDIGYLHNHTRMWFASIWIFTLKLPWALGAAHFLRHLIDGDAASNTLSWRWVAGLQTRGKTYLARASNINKFSADRFEMQGYDLASDADALPWDDPPSPAALAISTAFPDQPYTLFVHEEDCALETLDLSTKPARIMVQAQPVERAIDPLSGPARAFTQNALDDAAQRAEDSGVPTERCSVAEAVAHTKTGTWAMAHVPVGPLADALSNGDMHRVVREEDALLWPYATKGFFKFKEAIPGALQTMGFAA